MASTALALAIRQPDDTSYRAAEVAGYYPRIATRRIRRLGRHYRIGSLAQLRVGLATPLAC